jgi:hypothetical protein
MNVLKSGSSSGQFWNVNKIEFAIGVEVKSN